MTNKKMFWLGILVIVLVFGMAVLSCESDKCSSCQGTGRHELCGGRGIIVTPGGSYSVDCTSCGKTGKCPSCGGDGRI